MNKILTVLALGALMHTSAIAADVASAPAPFDWSGSYIGISGGWVTGAANQRIPGYGPGIPVGSVSGALVGGYAGVRKEINNIVLGVEIGANWRFVDGNNLSGGGGGEMLDTKQNWDASAVAKIGAPIGKVLVYGLGGATVSSFSAQYSGGIPRSADATVWGLTAGAGIEAAISSNVTSRLEYRYTSFSEANVTCSLCGPTFVSPQEHSITLGISYKF